MKKTNKRPGLALDLRQGIQLFSALLLACMLAACSQEAQQRVLIKGSNTVGEELAPRLIAEYSKDHSALAISLETRGTGSGFYALFAGASDIAAASRGMIANEQVQARIRGVTLNDYVIGAYSVAVIVNTNCPCADMTAQQIRDIFTGTIQNWKEVGGPDRAIHLFVRDPVSGTSLGFQELAMENKPYTTNHLTELTTYAAIAQAVARDADAIGYATIQLGSQPGVKPVSVDGVPPLPDSVKAGKYPYARVLHLFTDKAKEKTEARDFIQFVLSTRGQQILDEMGFVPRP